MFKAKDQDASYVRHKPVMEDAPAISRAHAIKEPSGNKERLNQIRDNKKRTRFCGKVETVEGASLNSTITLLKS